MTGLIRDPLAAQRIPQGAEHAPSYWAATAGPAPPDDGALTRDRDAEVAIIGGGYTGLSCATYLAKEHGIEAVVLEANRPGWGCTGRNGGNCRAGMGRVPLGAWAKRWGRDGARALFDEQQAALQTVRDLIAEGGIDCERTDDGWMRLAHRPSRVKDLETMRDLYKDLCGHPCDLLSAADLARDHLVGGEAFGGLRSHDGFGVHPLKLANGVLAMARGAGAKVHGASPVIEWGKESGHHLLTTPGGRVRARRVVLATNGYAGQALHPILKATTIPVISIVGVTRPMTTGEKAASNFLTELPLSDTRHTLFYYRRLPDDRILMGGRGPIHEEPAALAAWKARILAVIKTKFPALEQITLDYFWSGWVCLTLDAMPHLAEAEDDPTLTYAIGYNGTGIAPGLHCGRLLAERIGTGQWSPPTMLTTPLPKIPFAAFRRLGQRGVFAWHRLRDERG